MKYLTCIQNIASVIILYYLYKNVTAINSNIDTIKQELTTEEDTTTLKEDEIVETEEDKVPYLQTTFSNL
jgi:hypothetical protein